MPHPTERQLIDHARGVPPDAPAIAEHLAVCEACRQRSAELQCLWQTLGSWQLPAGAGRGASPDLAARILERLPAARHGQEWWRYSRVAAAIAVSVLLGHLAGRAVSPPPASPDAPVAEGAAAEALYLSVMADPPDLERVLDVQAPSAGGPG